MKKVVSIITATAMAASLAMIGTMNSFAADGDTSDTSVSADTTKSDIVATEIKAPVIKDVIYNGQVQELVTAGSVTDNSGIIMYASSNAESDKLPTDIDWSEDLPKAIYAGDYNVWYKVVGDSSHNDVAPVKLTSSIKQKEIELVLSSNTFDYNGELQQPTVTAGGLVDGDNCNVTVTYSAQSINEGIYTVTATGLSNSNYKLPENATKEYEIRPVALDIQKIVGNWKYQQATENTTVDVSAKDNGTVVIKADSTYTYKDASGKTTSGTVKLGIEEIGNSYIQTVNFYSGDEFKFGGPYRSETNEISLGNGDLARLIRDNSGVAQTTTKVATTTTAASSKTNSPKTGVAFPALPTAVAVAATVAVAFLLKKKED